MPALSPECPSPKPEESKGERAAGNIIYFHLNMEGRAHTPPSPFQGECIFISNPFAICPAWEGGTRPGGPSPLTSPSLEEGLTTGGEGRSHTRQSVSSHGMEETRQRGAAPEAGREWNGPQLLCFLKIL